MENKVFDDEIDLVWLFYALLKRIWIIVAVAVISACAVAGYTYVKTEPTYTSTSTMLVLTKETTLTSLADLQIGSQLTKDYMVLITSRPVLEQVIENLELKASYKQLKSQISITNPEDTRILNISVTMNNAKTAKAVVDELAVVSKQFIGDMMEVNPPKIIEEGEVNVFKVGPSITRNAMIGFLLGALLVCVIVIVIELLNDSIQTDEDVERYLGIPVLADVPNKTMGHKKERYGKGKAK